MITTATIGFYLVVKVKGGKHPKKIAAKIKQALMETIERMQTGIEVGAMCDGDGYQSGDVDDFPELPPNLP